MTINVKGPSTNSRPQMTVLDPSGNRVANSDAAAVSQSISESYSPTVCGTYQLLIIECNGSLLGTFSNYEISVVQAPL